MKLWPTESRFVPQWFAVVWFALAGAGPSLCSDPGAQAAEPPPAEAPAGAPAIEAGRDALRAGRSFPWYDEKNDALQPVDVRTPRPSASRSANPGGLGLLQWLAWTALLVMFTAVIFWLARAYLDRERRTVDQVLGHDGPHHVHEGLRIAEMPFMAKRAQTDLLGHARQCYERGDYREAIVYLFSFQLLHLDQHGLVRLDKGKTNRRYLRELHGQPPLAALVEQTMTAFERVFFGNYNLDRPGFEACWRRLGEFEQLATQHELARV